MKEEHKQWIKQHCLLPLIRGKGYDFEALSNKFDNLTNNFWKKAFELTPVDWRSDQFDSIKHILTNISVNNRIHFIQELKKIMS